MTKIDNNHNKKKHFRLSNITIAIIVVAVVFGLSFWFFSSSVNKKMSQAKIASTEELALHDQNSIENSVMIRLTMLKAMANKLDEKEFSTIDEMLVDLPKITKSVLSADRVSVLDSNGTQYSSTGLVENNSSFARVCEGKEEAFVTRINTEAHFNEGRREILVEAVPTHFYVDGHEFEWLICQFKMDKLEEELKINSYNDNGYSSVIDAEGNCIINISNTTSFLDIENFFDDLSNAKFKGYKDIKELCQATTGMTSVLYSLKGQEHILVVSTMDIAGWYFITTVPTSVFAEQTNAIVRIYVILFIIVAVVVAIGFVLLARQKKQQNELEISEAANKSKTEFLFNMSHDIRTPMNAILGYTNIGLRHVDDVERSKDSYNKIKMAGGHLLNLINDILEMSRIESGNLELVESEVDVRKVTEGIKNMSLALAMPKDIDLEVIIGDLANPYVYADELHVNEVVINLISNAIKYTNPGGRVIYTVDQISGVIDGKVTYRFEVIDNGIGMSDEFQRHLFEAFSRESSSTVAKTEGAGLGLSIVKRIVDLSGGEVSAKSKLNEGSTFTVVMPFRVMEDVEIGKFVAKGKEEDFSLEDIILEDKKVLLVEDNEMNREIAIDILSETGLIVDSADDGELAVKKVLEKGISYYDFILMDIQMPVMNGYEATKAIRALPNGEKATIIALSANAFKEDVDKSLEAGMNAHVAKPIDVKELIEVLKKFI